MLEKPEISAGLMSFLARKQRLYLLGTQSNGAVMQTSSITAVVIRRLSSQGVSVTYEWRRIGYIS